MKSLSFILDVAQAQAWVILVAAVGAVIVSVINAVKSKANGKKLEVADRKLDEIHVLTNNNLTAVKADLEMARKDISFLKEYISKNTTPPKPDEPQPEFIAKIELVPPAVESSNSPKP